MPKIHASSDVQTKNIGENTVIWQYCVVLPQAVIGCDCNINCHVFVENDVVIGDNVTVKPGVQLWDGMRVGNDVFIGANVTFVNDHAPRSKVRDYLLLASTIKRGASIGANATILGGITIGEYAMVGAGSVVTHDVPPFAVFRGNPARHCGYVTKDGTVVSLGFRDKNCFSYRLVNGEPLPIESVCSKSNTA